MLLNLPRYWKQCRETRARMDVEASRVPYGTHRRQYSIVLRPRQGQFRQPGRYAFYFHGGGWTFGRPETFAAAAGPWLKEGFTVILPSYRRPPAVGLRRIAEDCRRAIASFAPAGGPEPLIHVGGISAGAHLAALMATDPDHWLTAGWRSTPQKALLCAGPLSLELLCGSSLVMPRYQSLNPVNRLEGALENYPREWLLLHGTSDLVVDIAHSRAFYRILQAKRQHAHLEVLPGGSHLDAGRWMFGEQCAQLVQDFIAR